MARKCFYSFHYDPDNWRASTIRNIGKIEGNKSTSDNNWETITKGGDAKIKKWIADEMNGRTCTVILAGSGTANRKWINHEIIESWNNNMGVVVVHIHKIANSSGKQCTKGTNPLYHILIGPAGNRVKLSTVAKAYDPPRETSKGAYSYISDNIEDWVEEAIKIRKDN